MTIPRPISAPPWTQRDRVPAVFDRDGKTVSFVENGEYVLAVVQIHDDLRKALIEMTQAYQLASHLLGHSEAEISAATAGAREIIERSKPGGA